MKALQTAAATAAATLVVLFLTGAKSPPRKVEPVKAPCDVPCLEAKNAALQKLAAKRLKLASRYERQRNGLKRVMRMRAARSVWTGLLCIHGHEGAWNAATGNGFFGGLQMNAAFQGYYGRPLVSVLGSANRWPAEAQLAVGVIAYYAGRGYGPWPNTRRMCGL